MATKKKPPSKSSKSRNAKTGKSKDALMLAMRDFVRSRGPEFLKDKNISSVGVGYKSKSGKVTKTIAIQFTVARKALPEQLEALGTAPIPSSFEIGGVTVPTDVVQRQFDIEYRMVTELAGNVRKSRQDPVVPGISIANHRETAGTFGCIVYDNKNGTPYVLSNWHVLHGPNGAIGDRIAQPGPHDDNRVEQNVMGRLVRSHLGHAGDCAICSIEGRGFKTDVLDLGVTVSALGEPDLGDKIIKSGRTTAVTHGVVTRVHTIVKLDYGGAVGEREVGGFEIGPDPARPADNDEISMGGDSGSAWLFKAPNGKAKAIMAGLHFAGEGSGDPNEHAIACYPKSVFEKLEIVPALPAGVQLAPALGYDPAFLGKMVAPPKLSAANKRHAFKRDGSEKVDYTHFSLALNTARRFAFWVGWNIEGSGLRKLSRRGIPFIIDPDIPPEFQAGDELYAGNRLDRGHIARRADLLWGKLTEARRANVDSFYFTNITPQIDNFNQSGLGGLWGQLEDAVFADTEVNELRVSAFGGPVFHDDDREFRDVKLPREYWKVIAFVEGGKLKAKGFVLTQSLDQLEALDLSEFKVYQVALAEIEGRCGLTFDPALKAADTVGERLTRRAEALQTRNPLASLVEIDWT